MKNLKKTLFSGGFLAFALMGANAVNFIFNAILGRVLSFEAFGVITLISTLFYIGSVFYNSLTATINHQTASYKNVNGKSEQFTLFVIKRAMVINVVLLIFWLLFTPVIANSFHVKDYVIIYFFSLEILLYPLVYIQRGYFQGEFLFSFAAIVILFEPFLKLILAILLIILHQVTLMYLSIYISSLCTVALSLVIFEKSKSLVRNVDQVALQFPTKFYLFALLGGISTIPFLALDVILVKHFLNPVEAGQYSLLSLIGKIIYFLGSLFSIFIISFVGRDERNNKNPLNSFYKLLLASVLVDGVGYILLGVFGSIFTPILFGKKVFAIFPYLNLYGLSIFLFTINVSFITFHLARKQYIFPVISSILSLFFICGIFLFHKNISEIVSTIFLTNIFNSILLFLFHLKYRNYSKNRSFQEIYQNKFLLTEPTVSICIPAYNEQNNIDHILKQIFSQKQLNYKIEKIIVASDGSTDDTVKIAKKYTDNGVIVIDGKENKGQTYRQNEMISQVSSDILVLLNADLLLKNNEVIYKLILPVIKGADLSAQWARPIHPKTFFERILCTGFNLKYFIYTRLNNGNNIYTCVGHMRALSKRFYKSVRFPDASLGEDQFLYLTCVSKKYRYEYSHATHVFFKLPDNIMDYLKYAKRIFQTQVKYADIFDKEIVKSERKIPILLLINGMLFAMFKYPLTSILYIIIHFLVQQWSLRQPFHTSHVFEISQSTKLLTETSLT